MHDTKATASHSTIGDYILHTRARLTPSSRTQYVSIDYISHTRDKDTAHGVTLVLSTVGERGPDKERLASPDRRQEPTVAAATETTR